MFMWKLIGRLRVVGLVLYLCLLVFSCKKGDEGKLLPPPAETGIEFAYPYDGAEDVPARARLYLKFMEPLSQQQALQGIRLANEQGATVSAELVVSDSNSKIVQMAGTALEAGKTYSIRSSVIGGVEKIISSFTIRNNVPRGDGGFRVVTSFPAPGSGIPFMDFSSLRLSFSEPIDPTTVRQGESFFFTNKNGRGVSGNLVVAGNHLTFDPDEDLKGDGPYTVSLTSDIRDQLGEKLEPYTMSLEPRSSGDKANVVLAVSPGFSASGLSLPKPSSLLAARTVNRISIKTKMIGSPLVNVKGFMSAEIGDARATGDVLAIALRKGQRLKASAMNVTLGGGVPTILSTGEIEMVMSADSASYIIGNPNSKNPDAPAYVLMVMDMVMLGSDARGNGNLNQDVMHVVGVGTALVVGGGLEIDLVGAFEINLLGVEQAVGNIVFHIETPENQMVLPGDQTAPELMSSYPVDAGQDVMRDDTLLFHFSEPLSVKELEGQVLLRKVAGGETVPIRYTMSGSTLKVVPESLLSFAAEYELELGEGIRDLAGNAFAGVKLSFKTEVFDPALPYPVFVKALYPGYPCVLTGGDWKSGGQDAGRCDGGQVTDDHFDVFKMPVGRPIEAFFSKPLKPGSVTIRSTCDGTGSLRVAQVDETGACLEIVPGKLQITDRSLRFVPEKPWTPGKLYSLTLYGGGDETCQAGEICGLDDDKPLDTDILNAKEVLDCKAWLFGGCIAKTWLNEPEAGGPELEIPFRGAEAEDDKLLLSLGKRPYTDLNGNGRVDASETKQDANRIGIAVSKVSGALLSAAKLLGDGKLFLNGTLFQSIGKYDPTTGRIPVEIYSQFITGTEITIEATALGNTLTNPTKVQLLRLRGDAPDKPGSGYIHVGADGKAEFVMPLRVYMDAPYLRIWMQVIVWLGINHTMHSLESNMTLRGPVLFHEDGRMGVQLTNTSASDLDVTLSAGSIPAGTITLTIPVGGVKLQLYSNHGKRIQNDLRLSE